jgi:hypothetical protein
MDDGPANEDGSAGWIKPQRGVEISQGAFVVALKPKGVATVSVQPSVARSQLDRGAKVCYRL